MNLLHNFSQFFKKTSNSVAIIGCGASGIMVLQNLAEKYSNIEIDIFDKNFHTLGVAYDTSNAQHLLNVRAGNMSAIEDDSGHFARWLQENGWAFTENDFVPRPIYGLYLKDILHNTLQKAKNKNIEIKFHHKQLENIKKCRQNFKIDGKIYEKIYLCIGMEFENKETNFWCIEKNKMLEKLQNEKEIHIVGMGLSAFDAVFSIVLNGFDGKIILHSRTGNLTTPYKNYNISEKPNITLENFTLKNFITLCKTENIDAVIDSIRPISSQLWQKLSIKEKKFVMKHCFGHWNKHRHRSPESQYHKILEMINSGKIVLSTEKPPQNAIHCTGFNLKNITKLEENLIKNKIIKQDELQMGIVSNMQNFRIIGSKNFGTLFETTAIPELRLQAKNL